MYGSHMYNMGTIGYLILWIHYVADIFIMGARGFSDFKDHPISLMSFVGVLISWPYTRLWAFGHMIYWSTQVNF